MKLLEKTPKKLLINITPLVDVLFILIIFFVVTSTFIEQPGVKLELPRATTARPEKVEKAVLTITRDKTLFFQGQKVTLETLPERLQQAMEQSPDHSLIINADEHVEHGFVIQVMDIARQNGVQKVVIATKANE